MTNRKSIKYRIEDIISIEQLERLLTKYTNSINVATAIVGIEGNVLVASGWQDICTKFHRVNPETCKRCNESDVVLANNLSKGVKYNLYRCLNGMVDVAVPIIIEGQHIGNLFAGQFLSDKPDFKFFESQAKKYNFDKEEYLEALSRVPVISEPKIKKIIDFLLELAVVIGEIGLSKLKLKELTNNQEQIIISSTKRLKESEERWVFALEGAGDGVWDWNLKTDDLFFSDRWKTMLGYEPDDLQNSFSTWQKLVHPDDKEKAEKGFTDCLSGRIPFYQNEQRLKRKDGSYCWILDRGKVVSYDEDGRPFRFIGTHADISEIKKTQEELKESRSVAIKLMEEAKKAKKSAEDANYKLQELMDDLKRSNEELEQFAYVASHDLQEPLRMVSSFTQLLANKYKGKIDEKADMYINYTIDGATRMQTLINNLLDFSRISTRGNKFELVDTHDVLGLAINSLISKIEENNAIITNDELPMIFADKEQLARVFQNLIANAIKFKKDNKPSVHISAKLIDKNWQFKVVDNGIGIDKKYKDKIFVIFQRLHSRNDYEGNGIGLSICKRIVNRHKGTIWFESEIGQGTTFYFTIPNVKIELKNKTKD